MKIFHTSDWYLGHKLYGYNREQEHGHFLRWLLQQIREQRPDALLIVGNTFSGYDISSKSYRLFQDFLVQLTQENPEMRIVITTGDQDYQKQTESSEVLYNGLGVQIRTSLPLNNKGDIDYEELCIPIGAVKNPNDSVVLLAVPYLKESDIKLIERKEKNILAFYKKLVNVAAKRFPSSPVIMMAHLLAVGSKVISSDGENNAVDIASLSENTSYMALGNIHNVQSVKGTNNVWYSGSPLALDFNEKDYHHGINMVNIQQDGQITGQQLEYKSLCPLMTFPEEGGALLKDVIKQVASFEKKNDKSDLSASPYLEINVKEENPSEEVLEILKKEIAQRQIRVCLIKQIENDKKYTDITSEDIQQLVPGKIARELYYQQYGEEMPDDIVQLLVNVKRKCESFLKKE